MKNRSKRSQKQKPSKSQTKRVKAQGGLTDMEAELFELRRKLRMARICMESNDPLNAREIFGAPESEPPFDTAKAEGESPQAQAPQGPFDETEDETTMQPRPGEP